jgi:hypothetical protein
MEVVRGLTAFRGRAAGTDAERRAANWLAARLGEQGRRAEVEPTHVHPHFALVHAGHCAMGVAGSLLSIAQPAVGFALVLAAAASMYLDLNARHYLLRRLFFRRASQNVVSPGPRPGAPARLYLSAHYDAGLTGAVFRPRMAARLSALARLSPVPFGPFRPLFWSLALLLPVLGARMAGLEGVAVSVLQLPPTLVLLTGCFLLVDVQLSDVVPGANDNASGVAAVLGLAAELDRDPPENLDVWVLLTGGQECLMEGMHGFLRRHRSELDRDRTYFLNIDAVGAGDLRYLTGEGLAVTVQMDRRMVELCEAVAEASGGDGSEPAAEPLAHGSAGDALAARLARYPAAGLTALEPGAISPSRHHRPDDTPEGVEAAALDRAGRFAASLVRALDRDVDRRARV